MRQGAIQTHVVVFRNDQGQIASWIGRKAKPVATSFEEAKRFNQVEAHRTARRFNKALKAHAVSGSYAAEEASQWTP